MPYPIPRPFNNAFKPATLRTTITRILIMAGFVFVRIFTPTNEPSIIPITEGTTISGSTAPLFIYIQAADVSVIDNRNLLVATEILMGAPINRFNTGTFAHPAPSPNIPAIMPIITKRQSA